MANLVLEILIRTCPPPLGWDRIPKILFECSPYTLFQRRVQHLKKIQNCQVFLIPLSKETLGKEFLIQNFGIM